MTNKMKTWNTLGKLAAFFLSIALFFSLILSALFYSVSVFIQPEHIADVVQNINYSELILEDEDISQFLEESGIDPEFAEGLLSSDTMHDMITLYGDDLFASFAGDEYSTLFNPESISQIIQLNADELVEEARHYFSTLEDVDLSAMSNGEIKQVILDNADELSEQIFDILPTPEEIVVTTDNGDPDAEKNTQQVMRSIAELQNGTYGLKVALVALVLSILIFVCRLPKKFQGFIWLAVDYILASGLLFLMVRGANAIIGQLEIQSSIESLLVSVAGDFFGKLQMFTIFVFVFAVIFVAAYVLLRIKKKPREEQVEPAL